MYMSMSDEMKERDPSFQMLFIYISIYFLSLSKIIPIPRRSSTETMSKKYSVTCSELLQARKSAKEAWRPSMVRACSLIYIYLRRDVCVCVWMGGER